MNGVLSDLSPFLDQNARLLAFPAKHKKKLLALWYLAGKVEAGRQYTEAELNELLNAWTRFSRSGDASPGVIQQTASQPDDRLQSLLESRPAPGAYGFYRALCLMIFCTGNTGFTSITRSTP